LVAGNKKPELTWVYARYIYSYAQIYWDETTNGHTNIYIEIWLFNIAMENHHFNRIKNFIYTSSISMGNFPVRYVK
jgi:hypothetical protein